MGSIFEESASEREERERRERDARVRYERSVEVISERCKRSVEVISERCKRIVAGYYTTHAPALEVTTSDVDLYRFEKNPEGWYAEFNTAKDAEKTGFQFTLWYHDEELQMQVFTFVDMIDFPITTS